MAVSFARRACLALLLLAWPSTVAAQTVVDVVLDAGGGCALRDDGRVGCWRDARLRAPDFVGHVPPIGPGEAAGVVPGLTDAIALGRGCALRRGGRVTCWDPARVHDVPDVDDAVAVEADCLVRRGGAVICGLHTQPVELELRASQVSVDDARRCLLMSAGRVRCLAGLELAFPVSDAAGLALGREHLCVRRRGGRVLCAGSDDYGQLGGRAGRRPTPVPGVRDAVDLVAGPWATCALTRGARVWCWGASFGADDRDAHPPRRLSELDGASAISMFTDRVAIVREGAVFVLYRGAVTRVALP